MREETRYCIGDEQSISALDWCALYAELSLSSRLALCVAR